MKPDPRFRNLPRHFWANVRTISQSSGYTQRGKDLIKVPTLHEIFHALNIISLTADHLTTDSIEPNELGQTLLDYYHYRAEVLNCFVEPRLMDADRTRQVFENGLLSLS